MDGDARSGPVVAGPREAGRSVTPVGEEFDHPTEVDAAFRTQRRVAIGYFLVFLVVTVAVPFVTVTLDWWSHARIVGGMSPSFVVAAVGLYVFFVVVAVAAASLANTVEDAMLGARAPSGPEKDG